MMFCRSVDWYVIGQRIQNTTTRRQEPNTQSAAALQSETYPEISKEQDVFRSCREQDQNRSCNVTGQLKEEWEDQELDGKAGTGRIA